MASRRDRTRSDAMSSDAVTGALSFDRRQVLGLSIGGALTAVMGSPAQAATLDYGIASIDPIYAAAYVALKQGLFGPSAGINYLNTQSGPRGKQLLAAKQIGASTSGANDSVALSIAGKQSVLVYTFDVRVPFANILINKDVFDSGVNAIEKLSGRSLGITAPQSATWLMAVFIAERAGLKDKVAIRPLGDFTTMMAAVKSKGVDACMATYAMLEKAKEEGWGVPLFEIVDASAWDKVFGGAVPGAATYVLAETIAQRPADVEALVSGLCKGTDYIFTNTSESVADLILADYLNGYSKAAVVSAITTFKSVWSKDNLIVPETYARLAGIMSGRQYSDAEMATATYEKNVDMKFVRKARGLA
jgi:NitT/TauT family transport system substrate-binding protein